jgi:hypothetical protein
LYNNLATYCELEPADHILGTQSRGYFDIAGKFDHEYVNYKRLSHLTVGLQALIESSRNPFHKSILNSTHGIFLFGTPLLGLRTDELESLVDDAELGRQRNNLIAQLKDGSEFLDNQREDLLGIWEDSKQKIFSFYETKKTPSVRKVNSSHPR